MYYNQGKRLLRYVSEKGTKMADEEHGRLAPEQKQQLLDFLNASPFYHHMGMEALDSEGGRSHPRRSGSTTTAATSIRRPPSTA